VEDGPRRGLAGAVPAAPRGRGLPCNRVLACRAAAAAAAAATRCCHGGESLARAVRVPKPPVQRRCPGSPPAIGDGEPTPRQPGLQRRSVRSRGPWVIHWGSAEGAGAASPQQPGPWRWAGSRHGRTPRSHLNARTTQTPRPGRPLCLLVHAAARVPRPACHGHPRHAMPSGRPTRCHHWGWVRGAVLGRGTRGGSARPGFASLWRCMRRARVPTAPGPSGSRFPPQHRRPGSCCSRNLRCAASWTARVRAAVETREPGEVQGITHWLSYCWRERTVLRWNRSFIFCSLASGAGLLPPGSRSTWEPGARVPPAPSTRQQTRRKQSVIRGWESGVPLRGGLLRRSCFQCWGTHPVADLGRKEILLWHRKARCCWEDVLGEDRVFALFPILFLTHPLQAAAKGGGALGEGKE